MSASGTYKDTIVTLSGCDSIVTLNLTINPTINQTENITNCGNYSWNGNTYNSSGTYRDTLQTLNGCDSVVTLNLIINPLEHQTKTSHLVEIIYGMEMYTTVLEPIVIPCKHQMDVIV